MYVISLANPTEYAGTFAILNFLLKSMLKNIFILNITSIF